MEKTLSILQVLYQSLIIPLVAFIAIQTYNINAGQKVTEARLQNAEQAQVKTIRRQETIIANQLLLCNYAEPGWPSHSKCDRDFK